ncbi:hypothetical protein FQZ97_567710 [compost metagenome]
MSRRLRSRDLPRARTPAHLSLPHLQTIEPRISPCCAPRPTLNVNFRFGVLQERCLGVGQAAHHHDGSLSALISLKKCSGNARDPADGAARQSPSLRLSRAERYVALRYICARHTHPQESGQYAVTRMPWQTPHPPGQISCGTLLMLLTSSQEHKNPLRGSL